MGREIKIVNGKIKREVKANNKTSGRVLLPAGWIGKEVTVTLNGKNIPVEDVEVTIDKDIDDVPSVERAIAERKTDATVPMEAKVIKVKEEYVQCMDDCKFQSLQDENRCGSDPYRTRDDCPKCPEFVKKPKKK